MREQSQNQQMNNNGGQQFQGGGGGSNQESEELKFLKEFEPLNPDERQRNEGEPVGLKNIGNSKNN
jgi:hypothetical protein